MAEFDDDDDRPRRRRDRDDEFDDGPRRRSFRSDDYVEDDYDDYDDGPRSRGGRYHPHRGGLILALGILSLLFCGLLGIPGWVMGASDLREIKAGRMDPEGRGLTQAGYICSIIGVCLLLLIILIYVAVFALVVAA